MPSLFSLSIFFIFILPQNTFERISFLLCYVDKIIRKRVKYIYYIYLVVIVVKTFFLHIYIIYVKRLKSLFYWRKVKTTWSDYIYPPKQNQYDIILYNVLLGRLSCLTLILKKCIHITYTAKGSDFSNVFFFLIV